MTLTLTLTLTLILILKLTLLRAIPILFFQEPANTLCLPPEPDCCQSTPVGITSITFF